MLLYSRSSAKRDTGNQRRTNSNKVHPGLNGEVFVLPPVSNDQQVVQAKHAKKPWALHLFGPNVQTALSISRDQDVKNQGDDEKCRKRSFQPSDVSSITQQYFEIAGRYVDGMWEESVRLPVQG
jgi:hypothetical protein